MLVEQDKHGVNVCFHEVEVTLAHVHRLVPVLYFFPALALGSRDIKSVPALSVCPLAVVVPSFSGRLCRRQVSAVAAKSGGCRNVEQRCGGNCCGVGYVDIVVRHVVTEYLLTNGIEGLPVLLERTNYLPLVALSGVIIVAVVIQVDRKGLCRNQLVLSDRTEHHIFRSLHTCDSGPCQRCHHVLGIAEGLYVRAEVSPVLRAVEGFGLPRTYLHVVRVVVGTLHEPCPAGTGRGSSQLLNVVLLLAIDKEVTVTVTIGIYCLIAIGICRHISLWQQSVTAVLLPEVLSRLILQQIEHSTLQVHPAVYVVGDVDVLKSVTILVRSIIQIIYLRRTIPRICKSSVIMIRTHQRASVFYWEVERFKTASCLKQVVSVLIHQVVNISLGISKSQHETYLRITVGIGSFVIHLHRVVGTTSDVVVIIGNIYVITRRSHYLEGIFYRSAKSHKAGCVSYNVERKSPSVRERGLDIGFRTRVVHLHIIGVLSL